MFMLETEYREQGLPPARMVNDGALHALHLLFPELDEGVKKGPSRAAPAEKKRPRMRPPLWRRPATNEA